MGYAKGRLLFQSISRFLIPCEHFRQVGDKSVRGKTVVLPRAYLSFVPQGDVRQPLDHRVEQLLGPSLAYWRQPRPQVSHDGRTSSNRIVNWWRVVAYHLGAGGKEQPIVAHRVPPGPEVYARLGNAFRTLRKWTHREGQRGDRYEGVTVDAFHRPAHGQHDSVLNDGRIKRESVTHQEATCEYKRLRAKFDRSPPTV